MLKVYIDGNVGTTGLKIHERLQKRGGVVFLEAKEEERKNPSVRKQLLNESDITFLCLPDDAAKEAVTFAENPAVKIIDASTAHRTNPNWAYGFPELGSSFRKAITEGTRVAVPGCHASGFLSLVYPLLNLDILDANFPVSCTSVTGYSGGGKQMIAEYETCFAKAKSDTSSTNEKADCGLSQNPLASPRQYGLSQQHKHLPEMQHVSGLKHAPLFSPIVSNFFSGMAVSVMLPARFLKKTASLKDIHTALSVFYEGQKLVKVLPLDTKQTFPDGFAAANAYANTNEMNILVAGNDERILLMSLFDNLGKGASGAAVQCMNIMTKNDETLGLI